MGRSIATQRDNNSANVDPAVWSWTSTLKTIWIAHWKMNSAYPTPRFNSMFESLTQRVWPQLESFSWSFGGEQSAATMHAFQQLLHSLASLTHMQFHFLDMSKEPHNEYHQVLLDTLTLIMKADRPKLKEFNARFITRNRIMRVPKPSHSWSLLTSLELDAIDEAFELGRFTQMKILNINRSFIGSTLAFFQSIGAHSMPHLENAILPSAMAKGRLSGGVTEADSQIIRCIMSEMKSLTHLQIIFEHWDHVTKFSWVNQIDAFPSLTDLTLIRVGGVGPPIPHNESTVLLVRSIGVLASLKRLFVRSPDVLSVTLLLELTSTWAARASTCLIQRLNLDIVARHASDAEEESSMCAMMKNLASLSHLTSISIKRHPPARALVAGQIPIQRRIIRDDAIATSYLPHLSAMRQLKVLLVDDYHYTITPAVLSEWTRVDQSNGMLAFPCLEMIELGFERASSSAADTAMMLDRFPQLDRVLLMSKGLEPSTESEVFIMKLQAFIKQRNEEGRKPKLTLRVW